MKKIFFLLYAKFWYKVDSKLYTMLKDNFNYEYYVRVYNDISKIKDVRTNLLTKEQKLEIDSFYKKYYGKKISYIWHNLMVSYNNAFDVRYLPPDIFIKIRNRLNLNDNSFSILYDKNLLYDFFQKTKIKLPKRLFYSINNMFFDSSNNNMSKNDFYKLISNVGEVFIKPTRLCDAGYSKNCRIINMREGIDIYSKETIKNIIEKYYNMDFVVQEKIVCHKSISDIYSKSVNTFSVYTFIWNNEVKIINKPVFKIGMGNSITDYSGISKDGLIMAIDNEGNLADFALCIKQNKKYFAHPDTKLIFKNHRIVNFQKILETAKTIHYYIPWINFCKWDLTIDVEGDPVLVEVEHSDEMFQQQILYKEGFFGQYTEELLSLVKKKKS